MKKISGNDSRSKSIGYEDFRSMAKDTALSAYEKIGFPDEYRAGKEDAIFEDLVSKLPALKSSGSKILDIGSGCSDLPKLLMKQAEHKNQQLVLLDSQEMLDQISLVGSNTRKIAARYPDCPSLFDEYVEQFDAILIYSVIQYVFAEGNIFDFVDKSLTLLAPHGRMLIGDIPNVSMRKRFFASESGAEYHRKFMRTDESPVVTFNQPEPGKIDDAVVFALAARGRATGYHSYIFPQASDLPMANRREDILIIRP